MFRRLSGLRVALRSLVHRRRVEEELDEEMQYHLERQIEEALEAGLTPREARCAALRAMGGIARSKEECRDVRRANIVADFLGDLRYAQRALRRSPGFAALAVALLALGIGANTAVFSVVNAVLLKPLPYPGADRIVTLHTAFVRTGESQALVSVANFRDWRDQSASFEAMATYRGGETPVVSGGPAEYARTAIVDGQFFSVFGVQPILGRVLADDGATPVNQAAVISYAFWHARFGGDDGVLGRTVRVGNNSVPIAAVMPAGFRFPRETDLWLPQAIRSNSRTSHNLFAVARLKPGVPLAQAQAELTAIAAGLERQHPASNEGRGVAVMRLQDDLVGAVRPTLYLVWGVVCVVLLIACANTATLLLGRATTRTREIAMRAALGASRTRIVRQLTTESLLLALVGGGAGLLLAYWGANVLAAVAPADVVRVAAPSIDGGVLAFTLAVALATSVVCGLVPALHASTSNPIDALKQAGTAVAGGRATRTRGLLVVAQIALAVVLLTGAGLLIKSLVALHQVDLGFRPDNVLVMKATGVRSRAETNAFFKEILARIAALPGVAAVGATSTPPGDLSMAGTGAHFVDRLPERRDSTSAPQTLLTIVAPGAFAAMGVPLRSGRDFAESDAGDGPLVAIVNEALVRQSFAGSDPIGRTIFCPFDRPDGMTIIGVVGDVRQRNPAIAPSPECYMPYTQHDYNNRTLSVVARTIGDPSALVTPIRRVAAEIAPDVPVSFTTMEATVSTRVEAPRFRAFLFAVFAAVAVCLSMAGVYGVTAYAAGQRSREIGLRMALGATRHAVLHLVLGRGLILGAAGLALGLVAAAGATRLLASMLFEVRPVDLQVYLGVVVLLGMVTLLASYIPARLAARMDPVQVLRAD